MATSYGALIAKRVAGVFLAIALAVSFMPLTAWAQTAQVEEPAAQEAVASDADAGLVAQANVAQGHFGTCNWRLESSGRLVIEPDGSASGGDLGDIHYNFHSGVVSGAAESNAPWYPRRDSITSVYIAPGVRGNNTMTGLFYNCKNLTNVNIANLDTSKVRYAGGMFDGCTSLASFTMPNFNFNNVTDIKYMFYGCTGLKSLDLRYIDTSKVVVMDRMFYGCSALTSLNLSGFKTTAAKQMFEMFRGCSSLTDLDLSAFKTDSLTNMRDMFYGCSSVKSIDISGFRVSTGCDRGSSLFYGCPALERVSVGDGWTFQGSGGLGTSLPTGNLALWCHLQDLHRSPDCRRAKQHGRRVREVSSFHTGSHHQLW